MHATRDGDPCKISNKAPTYFWRKNKTGHSHVVSITVTRATPDFPWKSKTIFTSYNTTYLDTTLVLIGQKSIDYCADKLIEIAANYLFNKNNIPNFLCLTA